MITPELLATILDFRKERDWEQFHSPRNLAAALSVEASELLEHFVWTSDQESKEVAAVQASRIEEEVADIVILLTYIANDLGINIEAAVQRKVEVNRLKYPVEKARGSNKKYTEI